MRALVLLAVLSGAVQTVRSASATTPLQCTNCNAACLCTATGGSTQNDMTPGEQCTLNCWISQCSNCAVETMVENVSNQISAYSNQLNALSDMLGAISGPPCPNNQNICGNNKCPVGGKCSDGSSPSFSFTTPAVPTIAAGAAASCSPVPFSSTCNTASTPVPTGNTCVDLSSLSLTAYQTNCLQKNFGTYPMAGGTEGMQERFIGHECPMCGACTSKRCSAACLNCLSKLLPPFEKDILELSLLPKPKKATDSQQCAIACPNMILGQGFESNPNNCSDDNNLSAQHDAYSSNWQTIYLPPAIQTIINQQSTAASGGINDNAAAPCCPSGASPSNATPTCCTTNSCAAGTNCPGSNCPLTTGSAYNANCAVTDSNNNPTGPNLYIPVGCTCSGFGGDSIEAYNDTMQAGFNYPQNGIIWMHCPLCPALYETQNKIVLLKHQVLEFLYANFTHYQGGNAAYQQYLTAINQNCQKVTDATGTAVNVCSLFNLQSPIAPEQEILFIPWEYTQRAYSASGAASYPKDNYFESGETYAMLQDLNVQHSLQDVANLLGLAYTVLGQVQASYKAAVTSCVTTQGAQTSNAQQAQLNQEMQDLNLQKAEIQHLMKVNQWLGFANQMTMVGMFVWQFMPEKLQKALRIPSLADKITTSFKSWRLQRIAFTGDFEEKLKLLVDRTLDDLKLKAGMNKNLGSTLKNMSDDDLFNLVDKDIASDFNNIADEAVKTAAKTLGYTGEEMRLINQAARTAARKMFGVLVRAAGLAGEDAAAVTADGAAGTAAAVDDTVDLVEDGVEDVLKEL